MSTHDMEGAVGAVLPPEIKIQVDTLKDLYDHNAKVLFNRYSSPSMKNAPVLDYLAFNKMAERLDLDKVDERLLYQGIQSYLMEAPKEAK